MKTKQAGFTLIELVVVIVILGIMAAIAAAKFEDLSADAAFAAVRGAAGEISSGGAINMATRITSDFTRGTVHNAAAESCAAYANAELAGGGITVFATAAGATGVDGLDYFVSPDNATVNCSLGQATDPMPTCTLNHVDDPARTATFVVYCVN